MANEGKKLIDKGDYYEIEDYEPIIERDDNGNVVSMICCPYIPKSFPTTYMLPVFNPSDNTWFWDNGDGTFSTISNDEYEARSKAMFPGRRSRYEKEPQ